MQRVFTGVRWTRAVLEVEPSITGPGVSIHRHLREFATAARTAEGLDRQNKGQSRWRWLLLLPSGFAAFLGIWQVNRYQWKVDLLEQREAGFQAAAESLDIVKSSTAEYTRTKGAGKFLHDESVYIGPRPRTVMGTANAGYTLITPFASSSGTHVTLVNRGWVPSEWRTDPKMRALGSPDIEVEIEGVVRGSENPTGFVPSNIPEKGLWFWVDISGLAASCGLPEDTALIEVYNGNRELGKQEKMPTTMDALAFKAQRPKQNSLYPLPKTMSEIMRVSVMPVDHRNYALTWFSLSGATAFLAMKALRRSPVKV